MTNVRVFGSVVRGELEPWSDVDSFGVDLDVVWTTVERDIPALHAAVTAILGADPELQE